MAPRGPASAFESETFGQDASFRLEQPVGSMTISPSGRDVALASKEGLHIIDLDSPYSPPRYLPHRTPWEVADVQWSPFAARDYWVISTSNQKALVWNLEARSWSDSIEFVLHGHTRAITDINFSAHNPDVLATCAVDSYVHCWDLRAPARPVNSFSDWFAGATQVKWSRQDEHVIASSHDKFLHVWDDRNGAYPVRTIEAHGTKIYGLDWNRFDPNKIVTCSLDRSTKFWDLNREDDVPERFIETPFPVWRARHTPFGWGLLLMPQRGSNDLHLYDRRAMNGQLESGPVRPVATFPGHDGQVKEFLWRSRGGIENGVDCREFQLVTWGSDQELRLHAIEPEIYTDIGYEKGVSKIQRLNFTRRGAVYRTFRDVPEETDSPLDQTPRSDMFPHQNQLMPFRPRAGTNVGMSKAPLSQIRGWVQGGRRFQKSAMHGRAFTRQSADPIAWLKNVKISSWDPDTLAEEIRQVGEKFKKVDFEVVDISHRKAVMSLQAPWGDAQSPVYLRVEMRFPKLYPRSANAVLTLQKSSFVDEPTHRLITTEIHTIAETYASRRRGCLEAVLRYLLREQNLEQIVAWVLGESLSDSKVLDSNALPAADDSSSDDDDPLDGPRNRLDASANLMVPLAKGCGAIWSETGKLVCFFPAKNKEPASFLNTLGVKNLEESESNRLFEGFGRLHTSSPARKATGGNRTADDDSGSDTSGSSWKSSSSSSSSFETEENIRGDIRGDIRGVSAYRVATGSGRPPRSRSPERSNQSTTGHNNKLTETSRISTVSIRDFEDLIPSKRELAAGYKIFGNGQEVCKHNATVAQNAGLSDLVSVWTLLGLVLDDAVPLEVVSDLSHTAGNDISIIARAASRSSLRQKPEVVELVGNRTLGRTRWGNHPLGSMYLIPAIFDHFERLGDVQMLAMISCVFASVLNKGIIPGDFEPEHSSPSDSAPQSFPSKDVARTFFQKEAAPDDYVVIDSINVPPNAGMRSRTGAPFPQARRIRNSANRHESDNSVGDDRSQPNSMAASASPEGSRPGTRRAGTNVPIYSSARASLSALTQSFSHSPPGHDTASVLAAGLKKYSPSGSLTPGWVSSGLFGGQSGSRSSRFSFHSSEAASQDSRDNNTTTNMRSSLSPSALRKSPRDGGGLQVAGRRSVKTVPASEVSGSTSNKKEPTRRKRIKTYLFNQDKLDVDEYPQSPLLDLTFGRRCRAYRACYAHLLDVWQLYVQRAEMLKFDGVTSAGGARDDATHQQTPHDPNLAFLERPTRTKVSTSRAPSPGLDVRRCCRGCGEALAPIEKNGVPIGWQCVNQGCPSRSDKVTRRNTCSICDRVLQGLSVPCLECGHLTCYACAQEWFVAEHINPSRRSSVAEEQPENDDDDDTDDDTPATCPTGCGCSCATLTTIDVPFPPQSRPSSQPNNTNNLVVPSPAQPPPAMSRQHSSHDAGTGSGSGSGVHRSSSVLFHADSSSSDGGALAAILALTQTHQRSRSVTGGSTPAPTGRSKASSSVSVQQPRPSLLSQPNSTSSVGQTDNDGDDFNSRDETDDSSLSERHANGQADDDDLNLNPWAGSKLATLGRGIGAGLSRGLSSKASDATIRRIK